MFIATGCVLGKVSLTADEDRVKCEKVLDLRDMIPQKVDGAVIGKFRFIQQIVCFRSRN